MTLVLDSAVAFIMEKIDLVLIGAEGVVESGGIINLVCKIIYDYIPVIDAIYWP